MCPKVETLSCMPFFILENGNLVIKAEVLLKQWNSYNINRAIYTINDLISILQQKNLI